MASEQYCLRWNDHRSTLLSNFERLLQTSVSVDCTLAAEGHCLKAHKVVLSACSPYLEMMLNQEKEKHPIIFMKDMKFKELQAILEYMYRGEVVVPQDQLAALLQAAESLQIKGLGCGDKAPTESGSKFLNQQQQPVQKQVQSLQVQSLQVQSLQVRQSVSASRVSENPAPQVVDLTDDRVPVNTSPGGRHLQETPKRTLPQVAPARVKRAVLTSGQIEKYNLNNNPTHFNQAAIPSAFLSQNNLTMTNTSQASGIGISHFHNIAVTSIATAVASPAKQPFTVRQINEPSGHAEYITRVITPPTAQRTETQEIRDSDRQPVVYKAKPRALSSTQRKCVQGNITQTSSGQNSSPATLPSQNAVPTIVSVASLEKTTPVRTTANDHVGNVQLETSSQLPEVQKTETVGQLQDNDSLPQDSLPETGADQVKEPEAEKSTPENQSNHSARKDPSLDKAGPSGQGNTVKSGRRGRAPAGERRFQCPECDKKFTQKGYLEKHLRIHDGDCYQCDVCDKTFLSRGTLIKHVRIHNTQTTPSTTPPQHKSPAQHKCQLCGAAFASAAELENHLTDHTLSVADEKE